jgi:hypothetical protein
MKPIVHSQPSTITSPCAPMRVQSATAVNKNR